MFQNIFRPIGRIWCEFHGDISTNLVKLIWLNEFFFGTWFSWQFQEFFGIFCYITLLLLLQKLAAPLNPSLTFFRSLLRFGRDLFQKAPLYFLSESTLGKNTQLPSLQESYSVKNIFLEVQKWNCHLRLLNSVNLPFLKFLGYHKTSKV